jgi:hypothetical protein
MMARNRGLPASDCRQFAYGKVRKSEKLAQYRDKGHDILTSVKAVMVSDKWHQIRRRLAPQLPGFSVCSLEIRDIDAMLSCIALRHTFEPHFDRFALDYLKCRRSLGISYPNSIADRIMILEVLYKSYEVLFGLPPIELMRRSVHFQGPPSEHSPHYHFGAADTFLRQVREGTQHQIANQELLLRHFVGYLQFARPEKFDKICGMVLGLKKYYEREAVAIAERYGHLLDPNEKSLEVRRRIIFDKLLEQLSQDIIPELDGEFQKAEDGMTRMKTHKIDLYLLWINELLKRPGNVRYLMRYLYERI